MSFFDDPDPVTVGHLRRDATCVLREVDSTSGASLFPASKSAKVSSANGVTTSITCSSYEDRHFIVITQTGKFGSLLTAWAEDRIDGLSKTYESHVLIGKRDDELLNVFAKQIMQHIAARSTKPLLLSIALDEAGRDSATFKSIIDAVIANAVW